MAKAKIKPAPTPESDLEKFIHYIQKLSRIKIKSSGLLFKDQALQKILARLINAKNANSNTALILAVRDNDIKALKALIQVSGININAKNSDGNSALIWAAHLNRTQTLKILIEVPGIHVNAKNLDGNTALIIAAHNKNIEAVKALLKVPGINVNAKNSQGYSALDLAMRNNDSKTIKILMQVPGIIVTFTGSGGNTALAWAAHIDYVKAGQAAIRPPHLDAPPPLILAVLNNNLKVIKRLLRDPRTNVNARDSKGCTALWYTLVFNKIEAVRELIKAKAIIDADDVNHAEFVCATFPDDINTAAKEVLNTLKP